MKNYVRLIREASRVRNKGWLLLERRTDWRHKTLGTLGYTIMEGGKWSGKPIYKIRETELPKGTRNYEFICFLMDYCKLRLVIVETDTSRREYLPKDLYLLNYELETFYSRRKKLEEWVDHIVGEENQQCFISSFGSIYPLLNAKRYMLNVNRDIYTLFKWFGDTRLADLAAKATGSKKIKKDDVRDAAKLTMVIERILNYEKEADELEQKIDDFLARCEQRKESWEVVVKNYNTGRLTVQDVLRIKAARKGLDKHLNTLALCET